MFTSPHWICEGVSISDSAVTVAGGGKVSNHVCLYSPAESNPVQAC